MTKMLIRRIPAVVLTVAILFTTVFALSISASALTFTMRTTMPSTDNEYYYSDKNPFYPAGYGLPNCTAYAYGRVYEITGKKPNLATSNAEDWYGYNMRNGYYSHGQTPRLGAVACWSYNGGGGHVAVVEYINTSTGEMILSNSAWSARYGTCEPFYLTYANVNDSNPGGSSWWNFQGYIYAVDSAEVVVNPGSGGNGGSGSNPVIIDDDSDNTDTPSVGKNYEKGVYQVTVDDYLMMRTGAGTRYSFVTKVPDGAKLQVTAVKKNEDLTWGETSYDGWDGWVALNYCKYTGGLDTWKDDVVPTEEPTEAPTTAPATQKATEPATTIPEVPTEAPTTAAPTTVALTTAAPTTLPEVPTEAPTEKATEPDFSNGIGTGDVNADGVIDIVDATLIQKAAAGMGNLTAKQLKWCDFDFDGKITIADATLVQKIASGIYNYYL